MKPVGLTFTLHSSANNKYRFNVIVIKTWSRSQNLYKTGNVGGD